MNRFWQLDEVLWFCMECSHWYHFHCCNSAPSEKSYNTLEDYLSIPLLKGGLAGVDGTAPLVFSAAMAEQRVLADGEESTSREKLVEDSLGCSATHFLEEKLKGAMTYVTAEIKCPRCDK